MLKNFLELMAKSDLIQLDCIYTPTSYCRIDPPTGDPDHVVVTFDWSDTNGDYKETLTEHQVEQGRFDPESQMFHFGHTQVRLLSTSALGL